MSTAEPLYIFLHIPKCGGTAFSAHVKCNLSKEEYLTVSPNPVEGYGTKEEVDRFIAALPASRRDKLKVIMGHSIYYGIHEHFDRPAKYFTFVRSPVNQAISQYNYILKNYTLFAKQNKYNWPADLPQNESDFNFSTWFEVFNANAQTSTILNYLIDGRNGTYGLIDIDGDHVERAKRVLDNFYFIGLTENFDEDSRFLYHELGFTKRIGYRVNETPRTNLNIDDEFIRHVADHVRLDQDLYDHAVELNAAFRRDHENYKVAIEQFERKARPVIPVRDIVRDTARRLFGLQAVIWLWKIKNALGR